MRRTRCEEKSRWRAHTLLIPKTTARKKLRVRIKSNQIRAFTEISCDSLGVWMTVMYVWLSVAKWLTDWLTNWLTDHRCASHQARISHHITECRFNHVPHPWLIHVSHGNWRQNCFFFHHHHHRSFYHVLDLVNLYSRTVSTWIARSSSSAGWCCCSCNGPMIIKPFAGHHRPYSTDRPDSTRKS